jgi:hypothetical protein
MRFGKTWVVLLVGSWHGIVGVAGEVRLNIRTKRIAWIEELSTELFSVNESTLSYNNLLHAFYLLPHQSFNQQKGHFIVDLGSDTTY